MMLYAQLREDDKNLRRCFAQRSRFFVFLVRSALFAGLGVWETLFSEDCGREWVEIPS